MGENRQGHDDGWEEWKNHVLAEQKRHNRSIESLVAGQATLTAGISHLATREDVQRVKDDVLTLRTKASVWGGVVGFLAGIGAGVLQWIIKSSL